MGSGRQSPHTLTRIPRWPPLQTLARSETVWLRRITEQLCALDSGGTQGRASHCALNSGSTDRCQLHQQLFLQLPHCPLPLPQLHYLV